MGGASGMDGNKGEAVEFFWAAALEGTLTASKRSTLRERYEETTGGATFADVASWLTALAARFPYEVSSAKRTPLSVNGDVDAVLTDGSQVKFEVKAQVKKDNFSDIIQSDWVRDQTDLLSLLIVQEGSIGAHFYGFGAAELKGVMVDPAWPAPALHLADLAGITDARARRKVGVEQPADLQAFVDRKWFLHITKEGARLCRFRDIAPIGHLLSGGQTNWRTKVNNVGRALLSLDPPSGVTWFTYHLYQGPGLKGRHKFHPASFAGARWF